MPKTATRRASVASAFPANAFTNFNSKTTRWVPQNALALAYASNLAYEPDNTIHQVASSWGLTALPSFTGPRDIQAYAASNADLILLVFRGTINEKQGRFDANNWIVNLEAFQVPVNQTFGISGRVHDGFATAFGTLWAQIGGALEQLWTNGQSVWITGHSLGGALAVLCAATLTFAQRKPFNGLYTFGQPRVGDPDFCGNCDTHFGQQYFRFVNNEDIVTRIPPRWFPHFPLPDRYGHCGTLRYFDATGVLHDDEHYWNSFLAGVDVGIKALIELPFAPVADHHMVSGYINHIEAYINGGCQPPMQS